MSEPVTSEIDQLCTAKVIAELALADKQAPGSDRVAWSGNPLGRVVLVKGASGPAEESGGSALSGPDGEAADAALCALGFAQTDSFKTLSRPAAGLETAQVSARLVRQIEAVDPEAIVALDEIAAQDVARALSIGTLVPGRIVRSSGRVVIALEGLEASLADPRLKRRVWAQFKHLSPAEPVW